MNNYIERISRTTLYFRCRVTWTYINHHQSEVSSMNSNSKQLLICWQGAWAKTRLPPPSVFRDRRLRDLNRLPQILLNNCVKTNSQYSRIYGYTVSHINDYTVLRLCLSHSWVSASYLVPLAIPFLYPRLSCSRIPRQANPNCLCRALRVKEAVGVCAAVGQAGACAGVWGRCKPSAATCSTDFIDILGCIGFTILALSI